MKDINGKIVFNATNLEPEDFVIMDTSNRESDNSGLPQDMKINIFESLYFPRAEGND